MWNSTTAVLKYNVKILLKFYLHGKQKHVHICVMNPMLCEDERSYMYIRLCSICVCDHLCRMQFVGRIQTFWHFFII